MSAKDQILQEMSSAPEAVLSEVLDFLRFLKAKQQQESPAIALVSPEGETQVTLATLQQEIPTLASQMPSAQKPIAQVRRELNRALTNSGFDSKEALVGLVRDVKREMLSERESN